MMSNAIGMRVVVDAGETAKLFDVWNSANRKLLVLAQNSETAAYIALCHGHVKSVANAVVGLVDLTCPKPHEEKFFSSIGSAIRDSRQGVVRDLDGFAVVGGSTHIKTYAPLVEVKNQ